MAQTATPPTDGLSARPLDGDGVPGRLDACDQPTWDMLLARPDLPPQTVRWLIRQATGWPDYDFARREDLYRTLLASPLPLTTGHLIELTRQDGVPSAACALQLLAHPAANIRVVTALAGALMNGWGEPTFDERWGGRTQRQAAESLTEDPRPWVSVPTRIRRRGLAAWHPNWQQVKGLMRGVGEAHRNYAAAMVEIDGYGDAGWRLVAAAPQLQGPALVTAARGVLGGSASTATRPST